MISPEEPDLGLAEDVYGIRATSIDDARDLIGNALQLRFVAHESSYIGDYYLAEGREGESFKIRSNLDPLDDLHEFLDFPDNAILLLVEDTRRSSELRRQLVDLPGVEHLRHRK